MDLCQNPCLRPWLGIPETSFLNRQAWLSARWNLACPIPKGFEWSLPLLIHEFHAKEFHAYFCILEIFTCFLDFNNWKLRKSLIDCMSISRMPLSTEIPSWSLSHLNVSVRSHSYELWARDQHLLQVPENFFLLLSLMHKPAPTGRVLFSAWISVWLAAARWNGLRADRLRLHVGLSAGFISFLGFPANSFNYVHLLVSSMKGMSCAARYWQAELTWSAPSFCFVHLHLVNSWHGYAMAVKTFSCSYLFSFVVQLVA